MPNGVVFNGCSYVPNSNYTSFKVFGPHGQMLGTVSSEEQAKTMIRNARSKEFELSQQEQGEELDEEFDKQNSTIPKF